MEIVFDRKGNPIEAILDKDEQLVLAKENNRRAKEFLQKDSLEKLTAAVQTFDMYDTGEKNV